ncbi:MAG: hypothetical protein R2909_08280 [Gemmatimonadales bacterium]
MGSTPVTSGARASRFDAVGEAIAIGERGGVPVEIYHLKAAYEPGWGTLMKAAGALVDSARARGVDVAADLYPYTAGGTGLEATIPSWAFDGGIDSLRARLTDPATRARLKREVETGSPGWWNIIEASGGWDAVVLANARNPDNERFTGKTIAAIAAELGKDPRDTAWDLVLQGSGRVTAIYHMMSEPDVRTALNFPGPQHRERRGRRARSWQGRPAGLRTAGATVPSQGDRQVRPGGWRDHALGGDSEDERLGRPPSDAARRAGFPGGLLADIVFDYETIQDRATYQSPVEFPAGIDYVIVNGTIVADHGKHTGARPGKVLYGPGKAASVAHPARKPARREGCA